MQNTTQYLLISALVVAMWPLSAQADEDQSIEVQPSFHRGRPIKPAHTQVDKTFHRTDVIMVKFREPLLIRLREGNLTDLGTGALLGAEEVLAGAAKGRWERVHGVAESKLDQWRQTAEANLGKVVADLNLYYHLYLPAGADPGASIDAFNSLEAVELAMPVPLPAPPPGCPAPPPVDCCNAQCPTEDPVPDFLPCQGYLDDATDGIGAECMWLVPGGTGTGVNIVDVEGSYNQNHAELSNVTLLGPGWTSAGDDPLRIFHGTAVLGEIGSISDGCGTTGIAYDSSLYFVTIYPDQGEPGNCAAISRALDSGKLRAGDVLLLEMQTGSPDPDPSGVPIEWNMCAYDVIVCAVGLNITVVEAAGNGGQNLDDPKFCPGGCSLFNPSFCPFCPAQDSGAIIVGAGNSPAPGCFPPPPPDQTGCGGPAAKVPPTVPQWTCKRGATASLRPPPTFSICSTAFPSPITIWTTSRGSARRRVHPRSLPGPARFSSRHTKRPQGQRRFLRRHRCGTTYGTPAPPSSP